MELPKEIQYIIFSHVKDYKDMRLLGEILNFKNIDYYLLIAMKYPELLPISFLYESDTIQNFNWKWAYLVVIQMLNEDVDIIKLILDRKYKKRSNFINNIHTNIFVFLLLIKKITFEEINILLKNNYYLLHDIYEEFINKGCELDEKTFIIYYTNYSSIHKLQILVNYLLKHNDFDLDKLDISILTKFEVYYHIYKYNKILGNRYLRKFFKNEDNFNYIIKILPKLINTNIQR